MTTAIRAIKNIEELYLERIVFLALLACVFLTSFLYIYLVNKTVFNIVERKNKEAVISTITQEVTNLEFKYISKRNSLTMDTAIEKGFKNPSDSDLSFISRKSLGQSVATHSEL